MEGEDQNNGLVALPRISDETSAFTHVPEHGFSLFLANRTKTVHFVRHAEGTHNEANHAYGDNTPVIYSTEGSWRFMDAHLTNKGIQQCVTARQSLLGDVKPQLVVVSPFTRTLQTAHIMFCAKGYPFLVHDLCRERSGKYTCDKRRTKSEIVNELSPMFDATNDSIDFDSFAYANEEDEDWEEDRESDESVTLRAIRMMQWLATRPEKEIAVVTHSSWLKHLFKAFGHRVEDKDKRTLHRLSGNAEIRSITLALHKGFYPEGHWHGDTFVPVHKSFRKLRYAPSQTHVADMHKHLRKHGSTKLPNVYPYGEPA
mmetsp:Transcript_14863/g.19495  ORF Transcript_14863/g.19495 Transcript_14863/m.19495 type:complete len:314 (+) Transcript_14863:125-1066(+)|eukprot:CAMPEP_0184016344 /NCGR_PEP_ID=MMETSP0954-20121128/6878_1 /TAXON_ID=627963 /ORGANISM="Aplanochytrium sp, Strain PBS07" /LENGTH=313 /DNA_ID=CAMNT_0026297357 /DNA_START=42 /DNA_END=983 /DNA_ORIENTATION=-